MITLTEVKTLLQISSTDYDSFITFNIPYVIESICDYCKNHFLDKDTYIRSDSVAFASTDNSITISDFANEFVAGDYLRIYGSIRNNGHCKVDSVSSTKLVVSEITLVDETVLNAVVFYRANYPRAIKLPAAKLINFLINKENTNVKSEKIDDYQITYQDSKSIHGFPNHLMQAFNSYYRCVFLERVYIDSNYY